MAQRLFAGIDCSTQSCKLVLIDLEQTDVIYTDSINYDKDLPQYHTLNGVIQGLGEGVSESDPQMWLDALEMLFTRLKKSSVSLSDIKAISVSGQQHGLVCLDAAGNLSRSRSKLWNDFSTAEECELLTRAIGGVDKMIAEVGNTQRTGYTAAKIFHLARHEPEAFEATSTFFLVHNFINWFLTGGKNNGVRVMEPGDTSGMALWHPARKSWSQKVLAAISPKLHQKLPPVLPSDQFIGKISPALVSRYGFDPECQIDAGCGDNMYGAVGTGNVEPGIVTISLGTSGTAYTFMEQAFIDPLGEIAAFCDSTGHHLPLLCVSNLANGYNAVLQQFQLSHQRFSEIVAAVPAGCGGRLLIPWYAGERTPDVPLAAPLYFGFGLDDFRPDYLCRAVLEGHILNLYDGFQRMPVTAKEIRLTGGLSQSEVWCQTIADIFETEVVPIQGEGAALGAALHAAWVYLKEAGSQTRLSEIVAPFVQLQEARRKSGIPHHITRYRILKKLFHTLSRQVRGQQAEADPFELRNQLIKLEAN
ncbi:MAG: FGGY family carbohydrate kinase [candidate division KSB1 bacterium]|nr:FGGY family carbohydrate kinase [candidate division KSB1 bacterium]